MSDFYYCCATKYWSAAQELGTADVHAASALRNWTWKTNCVCLLQLLLFCCAVERLLHFLSGCVANGLPTCVILSPANQHKRFLFIFKGITYLWMSLFLIVSTPFFSFVGMCWWSGELLPAVSAALQDPCADPGAARRKHPGHRRRRAQQQAGRRQHHQRRLPDGDEGPLPGRTGPPCHPPGTLPCHLRWGLLPSVQVRLYLYLSHPLSLCPSLTLSSISLSLLFSPSSSFFLSLSRPLVFQSISSFLSFSFTLCLFHYLFFISLTLFSSLSLPQSLSLTLSSLSLTLFCSFSISVSLSLFYAYTQACTHMQTSARLHTHIRPYK